MTFFSSPVHYPPSSSPRNVVSPHKRRRIEPDERREALRPIENEIGTGVSGCAGFLLEESDDEGDKFPAAHSESEATADPANGVDHARFQEDRESSELPAALVGLDQEHVSHSVAPVHHAPEPSMFRTPLNAKTYSGVSLRIRRRRQQLPEHYERLVAARSTFRPDRAQKHFYGIDIHHLVDEAKSALEIKSITSNNHHKTDEQRPHTLLASDQKSGRTHLWTEKYRAKKFTDLVGDERTHRSVLRWLKRWDSIVFPHQARPKPKRTLQEDTDAERQHRKVLLLAGPPGLGKTTLAHVCARQAGYETQEINASDERSRDIVRGRIRDMVGTENVRSLSSGAGGKGKRAGKPVCVVVDEVDGVVTGSGGGGEGGFIKALVDLLAVDQKNSKILADQTGGPNGRKRKGDKFRMLRPLILICNDVYHPSLRLLRQGSTAEIIHIRRPPLAMVVPRLQLIFEKEGIPCDSDGVRRLCEATWGVSSRKEHGTAGGDTSEGDMRGILVSAEWVAARLRERQKSGLEDAARLSRSWIEKNVVGDLAHGGGAARNLGRGGSKDVVERVFMHNAGFSVPAPSRRKVESEHPQHGQNSVGVAATGKRHAMERLKEMVENSGEDERIITGIACPGETKAIAC